MLLDTASLYFRAFFGVPDSVRAPDGTPVNAVRGLLDFISRLTTTYEPSDLICCWDDDWRPQWRVDLIPSYKAHRVEAPIPSGVDIEETPDPLVVQIPMIVEVLEALQIPIVGAPGYEADDVIGSLATQAKGHVDVVTGDRDLFQLVSDEHDVRVFYTARGVGKLEVVTDATLVGKYGVLPEQYVDFAVLRGDASDGLPGVKGVGEKTAAGLLKQYGDLAGIREAVADPTSSLAAGVRGKITEASDYLDVAPKVVEVATDITMPDVASRVAPRDEAAVTKVEQLRDRWGLGSSTTRVLRAYGNDV
ncbi:MAG: 5'-3' exonuclease [Nocardioidaceae bacterium]